MSCWSRSQEMGRRDLRSARSELKFLSPKAEDKGLHSIAIFLRTRKSHLCVREDSKSIKDFVARDWQPPWSVPPRGHPRSASSCWKEDSTRSFVDSPTFSGTEWFDPHFGNCFSLWFYSTWFCALSSDFRATFYDLRLPLFHLVTIKISGRPLLWFLNSWQSMTTSSLHKYIYGLCGLALGIIISLSRMGLCKSQNHCMREKGSFSLNLTDFCFY